MATTTSTSPGAILLRGSRMFSLPPKLSPPPRSRHLKDSTTQTYPTKQSIATPFVSRLSGDWGFKRALPEKKTGKAKNPYVRINHIDTCEGITDFAMATDHTVSLRKWHDMGVPISVPRPDSINAPTDYFNSVFEPEFDYTDIPPPQPGKLGTQDSKRWKFSGPALSTISEGRFQKYIEKQVNPRREAFRDFVRADTAAEMTAEARRVAYSQSRPLPAPVQPSDVSDEMLMAKLRFLREDKDRLSFLVCQFLDLAPVKLGGKLPQNNELSLISMGNPWTAHGVPKTHPSAGMMYSRTYSYLDNHPFYGPQYYHPPILARVLVPSDLATVRPIIGVGGWAVDITHDPTSSSNTQEGRRVKSALSYLKPNEPSVGKFWVKLVNAYATPGGKLRLKVDAATIPQKTVEREMRGIKSAMAMVGSPEMQEKSLALPRRLTAYKSYATVPGSASSYGLGGGSTY